MQKNNLKITENDVSPINEFNSLEELLNEVLIINSLTTDEDDRVIIRKGIKLIGVLTKKTDKTDYCVEGIEFQKNNEGEHSILGENYQATAPVSLYKLTYQNFQLRDPQFIFIPGKANEIIEILRKLQKNSSRY